MHSKHFQNPPKGFALVITVSMLVLLTLMAVGMLTLAGVATRSGTLNSAQAEAEANARMALMLALGELQRWAGPDTRITAPADLLDEGAAPLTGVWRSWEGSDHEQSGDMVGRPIAPDYDEKTQASPSQQADGTFADGQGRFLTWLVSGAGGSATPEDATTLVSKTASGGRIPLLADGSLAAGDDRQVHVEPIPVSEGGAYAWWVSGENQKSYLPVPHPARTDDEAGWSEMVQSHAVADPSIFGLDELLNDSSPARKVFSRNSIALLQGRGVELGAHQSFHDLSAISVGLLTNVATGGWRKDLSLLSETWEQQPYEGLELFQLSPGNHLDYTRPQEIATTGPKNDIPSQYISPGSVFYPWNDYRYNEQNTAANDEVHHRRAAVGSWTSLVNHATFYKQPSLNANGVPTIPFQTWRGTNDINAYNQLHKTRAFPQMARLQVIVSHFATNDYAANAPGRLRPCVLYTPVMTLWNPYNYEITMPASVGNWFSYYFHHALPIALRYQSLNSDFWSVQNSQPGYNSDRHIGINSTMQCRFEAQDLTFKPGETRVFSPQEDELFDVTYANKDAVNAAQVTIRMRPGVRYGGGQYYGLDRLLRPDVPLVKGNEYIATNNLYQQVTLPPGSSLKVNEARFDVPSINFNGVKVSGMHTQWNVNSVGNNDHGHYWCAYRSTQADGLYPPQTDLASASLSQVVENTGNPVPFLSLLYGSRMASENSIPTKGVVQATPAALFGSSGGYTYYCNNYPGMQSLVSSAWEFSYVPHTNGPGDDMLPNVSNSDQSGYIVTGVQSGTGIKNLVMNEFPYRPLASIAELSHWWIRGMNPAPPHAHNIIANSDATPLIPADDVVDRSSNSYWNDRENEQQDDSYCANHLLFDDWFFSSIAPEPTTFGPSGKTLRENYIEFLTGAESLANRSYRPIAGDAGSSPAAAAGIYSRHVEPVDSWKRIASRLEVQGMFNINSTSVKAWRALLGHARNQKVPYLDESGNPRLSADTDFAMPRTAVAGSTRAGEPLAGNYYASTEFAGYRVFTDEMLDFLADRIVEQVRERGPFLSLSEFVNRQLSGDDKLAIGGAIQVALNQLGEDNSLNPYEVMQDESNPSVADPPGNDDYVFPQAAIGHSTYGLPGWTRQADILRPLAPVLSARDDSFTIRAYGDARDAAGNIVARAWCEATVRRTRDFCDPSDDADITSLPMAKANRIFGRKFIITSFRWLNANEV